MCGITVMYSKSKTPKVTEMLKSFDLIRHRGPDRGRFFWNRKSIKGFQRLCINDLSTAGDQPMKRDGVTLMCNGEIFNYMDLVKRYHFLMNSRSDCEVILHLYRLIGIYNTVQALDGDFAFVLKSDNRVYAARDRIGVRPLFFGFTEDDDLVIASEAKALFMCKLVQHILPGKIYTFDLSSEYCRAPYVTENYYTIISNPTIKDGTNLRKLLDDATYKRLMTDRHVGCLLSGGLDSSIITSILCRLIGSKNVRTYSIGMEGSVDLYYARKVAEFLGTNHTEVIFTPEEGVNAIEDVIYAIETYDITTVRASVGMYLLGKWISKNTKDIVIFSGEGSDELLCGYLYFHYAPTPKDAHEESMRLISDLYKYDVKRADACISSHGLELRVPFLDRDVINFCTSLYGDVKAPNGGIEKKLLRNLFQNDLPSEVVNRRKDGFSDGVSGKKAWYEYIQEFITQKGWKTEAEYYKHVFDQKFKNYVPIDYYWLPKWVNSNGNPSGRVLEIFDTTIH